MKTIILTFLLYYGYCLKVNTFDSALTAKTLSNTESIDILKILNLDEVKNNKTPNSEAEEEEVLKHKMKKSDIMNFEQYLDSYLKLLRKFNKIKTNDQPYKYEVSHKTNNLTNILENDKNKDTFNQKEDDEYINNKIREVYNYLNNSQINCTNNTLENADINNFPSIYKDKYNETNSKLINNSLTDKHILNSQVITFNITSNKTTKNESININDKITYAFNVTIQNKNITQESNITNTIIENKTNTINNTKIENSEENIFKNDTDKKFNLTREYQNNETQMVSHNISKHHNHSIIISNHSNNLTKNQLNRSNEYVFNNDGFISNNQFNAVNLINSTNIQSLNKTTLKNIIIDDHIKTNSTINIEDKNDLKNTTRILISQTKEVNNFNESQLKTNSSKDIIEKNETIALENDSRRLRSKKDIQPIEIELSDKINLDAIYKKLKSKELEDIDRKQMKSKNSEKDDKIEYDTIEYNVYKKIINISLSLIVIGLLMGILLGLILVMYLNSKK